MTIRKAQEKDMARIDTLLMQVEAIHHNGRPDLFKAGRKKYTDEQLRHILNDPMTPVLVAADDNDNVLGYAFCIFREHKDDNILTDIRTLYIDDLCVDEQQRGQHIGKKLYEAVLLFARQHGCHNVTLNVWSCNKAAHAFYVKCGLKTQKIGMETVL